MQANWKYVQSTASHYSNSVSQANLHFLPRLCPFFDFSRWAKTRSDSADVSRILAASSRRSPSRSKNCACTLTFSVRRSALSKQRNARQRAMTAVQLISSFALSDLFIGGIETKDTHASISFGRTFFGEAASQWHCRFFRDYSRSTFFPARFWSVCHSDRTPQTLPEKATAPVYTRRARR